jgi:alcohol dehydrogenase
MTLSPFAIGRLPRILFGAGQLQALPSLVRRFGDRTLLITGARSFRNSTHWGWLQGQLNEFGVTTVYMRISAEPSPDLVDEAVARWHGTGIASVVAIGGGSVLDAGKAIAGLLPFGNSVMDHLEGVGRDVPYAGPALPFLAVPTTAGTGSEATKNAVLSRHGESGFKKSFRHDTLVPEYAIVDPDLLATCPPDLIAADGMDAFTQLLESYVSAKANPFTDALALSGMDWFRRGFFDALAGGDGEKARAGRAAIAYASLLSGITLAQAGLGSVHGLAAPLGAFFPIPHGVACGTLLAEATAVNVRALSERGEDSPALAKYAQISALLSGQTYTDDHHAAIALVELLREWTHRLGLKRLGELGIHAGDIDRIVANARGSSMQTNPLRLTDAELAEILTARL